MNCSFIKLIVLKDINIDQALNLLIVIQFTKATMTLFIYLLFYVVVLTHAVTAISVATTQLYVLKNLIECTLTGYFIRHIFSIAF